MAKRTCVNGHQYESNIYGDNCPFCPSQGGKTEVNQTSFNDEGGRTKVIGEETDLKKTELINDNGGGINVPPMGGGATVIRRVGDKTGMSPAGGGRRVVGVLVTYSTNPLGEVFKIYEGRNVIGRSPAVDIPVPSDSNMSSEHLRILSGFYGMLRPLDGVVPYRLEMQARLAVDGARNLYEFWEDALYETLAAEGCDAIVNVASVEYARAVTPWARPNGPQVTTCLFGVLRDGRLRQPATEAKAARGTFVRWCAERGVRTVNELRDFRECGYELSAERSSDDSLVFVRDAKLPFV